jgi:hypothetical protein
VNERKYKTLKWPDSKGIIGGEGVIKKMEPRKINQINYNAGGGNGKETLTRAMSVP